MEGIIHSLENRVSNRFLNKKADKVSKKKLVNNETVNGAAVARTKSVSKTPTAEGILSQVDAKKKIVEGTTAPARVVTSGVADSLYNSSKVS